MPLTGHEDHSISLETAAEWTANYRASAPTGAPIASYYGRDAISAILEQSDCVGIRIYYAKDDSEKQRLVLVGVDGDNNDLYEGELAERGMESPPYHLISNPLNS